MRQTSTIFLAVLVSHVYAAPQFITWKDGKLGVNFGGYHAGIGYGSLLGNGQGGLYAEAGTPFGQHAMAGISGSANSNSGPLGGLYAGATAGNNIQASAGLAGSTNGQKSEGVGFADAQAGGRHASAGLGGQASEGGAAGFTFSKSFGGYGGIVKETEVAVPPVESIEVKPIHKKVHTEINVDAANEVNFVPLTSAVKPFVEAKTEVQADVNANANVQPTVIVKEVYVEPPPPTIVEKHVVKTHYKPHRHHLRKTAFVRGYVGGNSEVAPAPVQPVLEKRIDIGAEGSVNAGVSAKSDVDNAGSGQVAYTKQVTFQKNPTFFQDIFNIPISTLKAVSSFLGNAAEGTNVSVQKSATVQAGANAHVGAYV